MATDKWLENVCLHLQLHLAPCSSLQRTAARNYLMLIDSGSNDPVQKAGLWDQCKSTLLIKKGQKSCLCSEKGIGFQTYLPLVEKYFSNQVSH